MAVAFPSNPSEGDIYQNPATGAYYQYTDDSWSVICFEDVEECDPTGTWSNEGETTTDNAPAYGFYWRYFDVDGTAPANTTMLYLGSNTRLYTSDFPDPDNLPNRIVLNGKTFVIRRFKPFGGGIIGDVQLYGDQRAFFQDAANDDVNYKFCTVDPVEDDSHPFVGKYRVVHPDDYTGENGTVAVKTESYDANDKEANWLAPNIKAVSFADLDLNGFGFGDKKANQIPDDVITFDIQNGKPDPRDTASYAFVSYKAVNQTNLYAWDIERIDVGLHFWQDGDILYVRNPSREQSANKTYVDYKVDELQNEIIELEEELEALAPSVERGVWKFTLTGDVNDNGDITFYDDTFGNGSPTGLFTAVKSIWLNSVDDGGTPHGFSNVEVGHLIEVFVQGDPDFGLYTVTEVHDQSAGPSSYWAFDVDFVRALDNPASAAAPGDLIRVKTFQAPSGGDASEFVKKSGDKMYGALTFARAEDVDPLGFIAPYEDDQGRDTSIIVESQGNINIHTKRLLQLFAVNNEDNPDQKVLVNIGQTGSTAYFSVYVHKDNARINTLKSYYQGFEFLTDLTFVAGGSEGFQIKGSDDYTKNFISTTSNEKIISWGSQGALNKKDHIFESNNEDLYFAVRGSYDDLADCRVQYYGRIEQDNDIVTKKYVDENSGGVEVLAGTPAAPIPVGKMWFDTTKNALYLKTSD